MSKLVFALLALILVSATLLISKPQSNPLTVQAWGKAQGDIAVRIVEEEAGNGYVTLRGEVQTVLDSVNFEWKLPDGVTVSDGNSTGLITRQPNEKTLITKITVRVSSEISKPHIVFFAYMDRNGHRLGNSRVFSLTKTEEEKNQTLKIQQIMKDRGDQPRH
jgi:hypothetical protein